MEAEEEEGLTKRQVRDRIPKRIKELQFGILSSQDIVSQSVLEVSDRHVYELNGGNGPNRAITRHGPLDKRMGTSSQGAKCDTCDRLLKDCNGHFGYVKLALPAFHIGYLKKIIDILHCICKDCSRVLLEEKSRRRFLKSLTQPTIDHAQRDGISKKVTAECRKYKYCPHCGAANGAIRKVPGHALKLVHERYRWYVQSTAKSKVSPVSKVLFDDSFTEAKKGNSELEKHLRKAADDMHPLRVLNLFREITSSDCVLLGMNPANACPEMLIWQYVPAPPVSIRPSVAQESASTEDDITNKLGDIIQISSIIRAGLDTGQPISTIMEQWDYLQIQVAMYINSDVPNLQQTGFGKPIRGFCQRLKGKQGRFRGNLSGKRVDFSGRTVISPDPNLGIDEVAVPERVAVNLTYPERVTDHNMDKLKACVKRGKFKHPGANFVWKKATNRKIVLEVLARVPGDKLSSVAELLEIGDIVERHLEDGDIVLFNRQPSLHKLSIMSHKAKIRQWRTFRLNECVCTPYNADFDGDEMNLHVPQTEEARTEALELMGVKHNLATPKDGTPIIAATQDFITAAYLLSNKDRFYDRKSFVQICNYMFDGNAVRDPVKKKFRSLPDDRNGFLDIDLPEAAILKPEQLWTGKQVFNVLMRPSLKSKVLVNFDAQCKQYRPAEHSNYRAEDDAFLCIRNSEVMSGVMDKNTVGPGKKDSIFYVIMRDFGPECAVQAMNRLAKLCARWLSNEGFSIGINDVYPSAELVRRKDELIKKAYLQCDSLINDFQLDRLTRDAGCNEEQTMENRISGVLSEVRQKAGAICFEQLSNWNSPLIMAKCGSKGSNINVSQMVAAVGQQIIGGSRVADGFQDRTLPHFPKAARQPPSKGFVRNSFFSGLTPTEFLFHAMSGREGLVDTAVKTAETGYMSRRLMKSLEDLSAQYDDTVRNSSAGIVQFQFGDDKLDPVDMEGRAKPVNFERTFIHAQASKWTNSERGLLPFEIADKTHDALQKQSMQLERKSLTGERLDYDDRSNYGIDQHESNRDFLRTIEEYMSRRGAEVGDVRQHVGMMAGREDDGGLNWAIADNLKQRYLADGVAKVSETTLKKFLKLCLTKYEKSKVQPGHAVGAVAAQSIGEPGTQMTLKTFHFAGVAGMSITQGVPRIKEIINASKVISTPVITCPLVEKKDTEAARVVKGRVEKTYLRDIITWINEYWTVDASYISLKISPIAIRALQLEVTMPEIRRTLIKTRGLRLDENLVKINGWYINVYLDDGSNGKKPRTKIITKDQQEEYYVRLQSLKRLLPNIVIKGYPEAIRAIISKDCKKNNEGIEENRLLVEGYGLKACMNTSGIDGVKTRTNSIMETHAVLGIEAARAIIIAELDAVMGNQMDIDPRHMQLLADVMTYKGDVLGITRFGLSKMRNSVLQLASFEKTPDHLFDAAIKGKTDKIEGVSECIIMGQSMRIGTGAMKVIRRLGLEEQDFKRKPTLFEDAFNEKKTKTKT